MNGAGLPSGRLGEGNMQQSSRHLTHLAPFSSSPLVFITASTFQRNRVLNNPIAHQCLHEIWTRSSELDGWFVGDYLLMPDHVHLFARPTPDAKMMRDWVKMWKSVGSRHIARALKIEGPIWQADYFDRFIRTSESYSDKWRYVEENPVRAGLVETADQWDYKGRIWNLRI
jgi:putative transposase